MKNNVSNISKFREFDYFQLKHFLSAYSNPHAKIRQLLANQTIIRIKKGLYVLGEAFSHHQPVYLEVLANLIYGPSAISLDYALGYYGLIPEHVRTITSITPQRDKQFTTPVGEFTYRYLSIKKYAVGLARLTLQDGRHVFIATPEKSLIDKIYFSKTLRLESTADIESYLFDDLRVDENLFASLNVSLFLEIARYYRNTPVSAVAKYVMERS